MKKTLLTTIIILGLFTNNNYSFEANHNINELILSESLVSYYYAAPNPNTTIAIDQYGNYLQFQTQYERDLFVLTQKPSNEMVSQHSFWGYTSTRRIIATKYYYKVFIGYNANTPHWSQASMYNLNTSRSSSVGVSLNFDGVVFSVNSSVGSGTSISIPADMSRWSKLGYLGDIRANKHEVKIFYNGKLHSISYPISGSIYSTYNIVMYR